MWELARTLIVCVGLHDGLPDDLQNQYIGFSDGRGPYATQDECKARVVTMTQHAVAMVQEEEGPGPVTSFAPKCVQLGVSA